MHRSSLTDVVTEVLARTPAWVRQDLTSKDASIRICAEQTLAAAIAAALAPDAEIAAEST